VLFGQALFGQGEAPAWFIFWRVAWLWFTVLFANFAEAMAEGRGKAQADSLRRPRDIRRGSWSSAGTRIRSASARTSRRRAPPAKGDVISSTAGEFIPSDGEIIDGIAPSTRARSPARARP
jgi:K+-transporting ATPase ATPase B chain